MTTPPTPYLLWVDIETTGLQHDAHILEVAVAVTTWGGEWLARTEAVYRPGNWEAAAAQLRLAPEVIAMHQASGLLGEALAQPCRFDSEAWRRMMSDVAEQLPDAPAGDRAAWTIAGSSPHFDLYHLQRAGALPAPLAAPYHYRLLDVSSVRAAAHAAGWADTAPATTPAHRAAADIEASVALYRRLLTHLGRAS